MGSFSDPEDLPGLAHFLEHSELHNSFCQFSLFCILSFLSICMPLPFSVVFMGSKKYPDENGFDAFLKKHGGSDNASTDCERTIFHFAVQRKYFKDALDR